MSVKFSDLRSAVALSILAAVAQSTAPAAQAGILTSATWIEISPVGFPMTRTSAQLSPTGSSTATSLAVNLSYPWFSTLFFIPKGGSVFPNLDLFASITRGGPLNLTATPSMAAATMGVQGAITLRTAIHNSKGVNQSGFTPGPNTLVMIPVSIGGGGQATDTFSVLGVYHIITADFYGWTPGTLVFTGLTQAGGALPNVIAAGSWALTAGGGGTVTLVAPVKISVDGSLGQRRTASYGSLKLYFVPEPSTLLLLGAGALALTLVDIRRG